MNKPGNDNLDLAPYAVTIDESNLVLRISMALNAYRHQQDRLSDLMDGMQKIITGG